MKFFPFSITASVLPSWTVSWLREVCTKSHPSVVGAASLLRNKKGDDRQWLGPTISPHFREGASATVQSKIENGCRFAAAIFHEAKLFNQQVNIIS